MKKDKNLPASKKIKSGPGSDPINKFKKGKTTSAAAIDNIITGAIENVKAENWFPNYFIFVRIINYLQTRLKYIRFNLSLIFY